MFNSMTHQVTLTQFLIEERRRFPGATGDFNAMLLNIARIIKVIARTVAMGKLADGAADAGAANVQGEIQYPLDVIANEAFLRGNDWCGHFAGMVSEELEAPYQIPKEYPRGKYLLLFDPLDGSSNIDVNAPVGTIFSVLRSQRDGENDDCEAGDFLQKGRTQVAAGYAIYGPSTLLVLTVGTGVHAFTLDPLTGDFMLTHRSLRIAEDAKEFAINSSNRRFWEPPVKRYVDECIAGNDGVRGKDFNMRWVASLVAEVHRILMRGGVFLYPKDTKDPSKPGRLRLLYECNPISMLIEQAGGLASTGRQRILDVEPTSLHQRIGFIFGAKHEVERIERYHNGDEPEYAPPPLFGERGLFRETA